MGVMRGTHGAGEPVMRITCRKCGKRCNSRAFVDPAERALISGANWPRIDMYSCVRRRTALTNTTLRLDITFQYAEKHLDLPAQMDRDEQHLGSSLQTQTYYGPNPVKIDFGLL